MNSLAIFKTLAYADIFDYPLETEELHRFLIAEESLTLLDFKKIVSQVLNNNSRLGKDKNYFFLKGRESIVSLRKKREGWARKKLLIAHQVAEKLKFIPWIKLVGITGALAMDNTPENDDIDLLLVTAGRRLWLTRFLTTVWLDFLKVRRRPKDRLVKDKICLNIFLDEDHLAIPEKERNLFLAHEICQLKLIWDKDKTYQKFLWENQWAKKYLPNGMREIGERKKRVEERNENKNLLLDFLEKLARKSQLWYMSKRRTTEKITDGRLFFHPQDCTSWVLKEYHKRISQYVS